MLAMCAGLSLARIPSASAQAMAPLETYDYRQNGDEGEKYPSWYVANLILEIMNGDGTRVGELLNMIEQGDIHLEDYGFSNAYFAQKYLAPYLPNLLKRYLNDPANNYYAWKIERILTLLNLEDRARWSASLAWGNPSIMNRLYEQFHAWETFPNRDTFLVGFVYD